MSNRLIIRNKTMVKALCGIFVLYASAQSYEMDRCDNDVEFRNHQECIAFVEEYHTYKLINGEEKSIQKYGSTREYIAFENMVGIPGCLGGLDGGESWLQMKRNALEQEAESRLEYIKAEEPLRETKEWKEYKKAKEQAHNTAEMKNFKKVEDFLFEKGYLFYNSSMRVVWGSEMTEEWWKTYEKAEEEAYNTKEYSAYIVASKQLDKTRSKELKELKILKDRLVDELYCRDWFVK